VICDSYQLERVHCKFLKYAYFALNIDCLPHNYTLVLEKLNLDTLSNKRINAISVFLSKLKNGEGVDAPNLLARVNFKVPSANLSTFSQFHVPMCATNYIYILYNKSVLRMMQLANEAHYS